MARARLHAAKRKWQGHGLHSSPNTKFHFTMHCLNRLHRRDSPLQSPQNKEDEQHVYAHAHKLSTIIIDKKLLSRLEANGPHMHSHLVARPWDELRGRWGTKSPPL